MQAQTKCIFEEINANVLVVGDYKAFNKDNPSMPIYIDVRVGACASGCLCSSTVVNIYLCNMSACMLQCCPKGYVQATRS